MNEPAIETLNTFVGEELKALAKVLLILLHYDPPPNVRLSALSRIEMATPGGPLVDECIAVLSGFPKDRRSAIVGFIRTGKSLISIHGPSQTSLINSIEEGGTKA